MSRARLNFNHNFSSRTGLSIHAYIILRDMRRWTSPSRTRLVGGKLTRSHLFRNENSLHLRPQLRPHLPRHLHSHRRLHLNLQLHLHLEAKKKLVLRLPQGSGYSNKRSSESRQICDHVSMVSRRANNSFFARNVRPVIIASRFATFGSASLNT